MNPEQREFLQSIQSLNPQYFNPNSNLGSRPTNTEQREFLQSVQALNPQYFNNLYCSECDQSFNNDIDFRVHKLMEIDLMNTGFAFFNFDNDSWQCTECGGAYDMRGITRHVNNAHIPPPSSYDCSHCGARFTTKANWAKHVVWEQDLLRPGMVMFDFLNQKYLCNICLHYFDAQHISRHIKKHLSRH